MSTPSTSGPPRPTPSRLRTVRAQAVDERGFQPLTFDTPRGAVAARWYPGPDTPRPDVTAGFVCVGGVGGGFDTPARNLYPTLCESLAPRGIAGLRVRFRHATDLAEATHDVLTGVEFLQNHGIGRVGLVGHSFGGAVVLRAAAEAAAVRAVVGLAAQSYGAEPARTLGDRCAVLLIHGTADTILPDRCSEQIARMLTGPSRLVLAQGAGHGLDEVAADVRALAADWLIAHLAADGAPTGTD